jgi:hypothetical protein
MAKTLRQLEILEVSMVDRPANPQAKVLLAKRAPEKKEARARQTKAARAYAKCIALAIAKGYMDGEAETLQEALDERAERELLDALWSSLCSIFNDDTLSEEQEAAMTQASFDQFMAQLKGDDTAVTKEAGMDLSKVAPEVKAHVEKLEADLTAARAELTKKAEPPKPEDVLKGLTPEARAHVESLQKKAEESEKQAKEANELAKSLQDKATTKEYVAKAAALKRLPAKPDELGAALKSVAAAAPDAYKEIERVLTAANEQIEKNDLLFKQLGASGGANDGEGTAYATARAKAQELVAKGEAKTLEQGVALVFKREPELYKQHRQEQTQKN